MGKVLVIAEKPDAGRNMAKVLKCDNCRTDILKMKNTSSHGQLDILLG